MTHAFTLFAALLAVAGTARAEVTQTRPGSFQIEIPARAEASAVRLYSAIVAVERWWDPAHTWSGASANLSLNASAGGCFCERWASGSAEHGRVIMASKNELLRLYAALGPLQAQPLTAVLEFELTPQDEETTLLKLSYRVSGAAESGLEQWASGVDQVLSGQMDRLLRFIDTGNADAEADAEAKDSAEAPSKREARAEIFAEWVRQAKAQSEAEKTATRKPPSKPKS